MLKPQDIVILLKLIVDHASKDWTYNSLAYELRMSASEIHKGIKRSTHAKLFNPHRKKPVRKALEEFLIHGVKYAFAPEIGRSTRGIPTAYATPVFDEHLSYSTEDVYVWPHPEGQYRGAELTPLYRTVPDVCLNNTRLYYALGALDAIRLGRTREVTIAESVLREMLFSK